MTEEKKTPIRISEGQMGDIRAACFADKDMQERYDELERKHGFEIIPNPKPGEFYSDVSVLFMYPSKIKPLDFSNLPADLKVELVEIAKADPVKAQILKDWEFVMPETVVAQPTSGLKKFMGDWIEATRNNKVVDSSQDITLLHIPAKIARMSKRRQKKAIAKRPLKLIGKLTGAYPISVGEISSDPDTAGRDTLPVTFNYDTLVKKG